MKKGWVLALVIMGLGACSDNTTVTIKTDNLKKDLDTLSVKADSALTRIGDSAGKSLRNFKRKIADELVKKDTVKINVH